MAIGANLTYSTWKKASSTFQNLLHKSAILTRSIRVTESLTAHYISALVLFSLSPTKTENRSKSIYSNSLRISQHTVSQTRCCVQPLCLGQQQKDYPLSLSVTRLIEVPCLGSPQPYKQHQMPVSSTPNAETDYRLDINIKFD